MKLLQTHPSTWSHGVWTSVSIDEDSFPSESTPIRNVSRESVNVRNAESGSLSRSLSVVRILAFCQAIFFLVLFLFVCAWAGAATIGKPTIDLRIISSAYTPQKERNPFGSGTLQPADGSAAKTSPEVAPGLLKLNGILYDPVHPSAVVNNQLVELKRAVKVLTGQGEIEVKALQIAREFILLEVGDQKLELWLSGREPDKQTK
jgi:hypothetical protein